MNVFHALKTLSYQVAGLAAEELRIKEIKNKAISAATPLGEGTIEGDNGDIYAFASQRYHFVVRDRVRFKEICKLDKKNKMPRRYAEKVRPVHRLLSWQTPITYM